ncbi:MAG: hypothetical protein ACREPT_07945 [Rudaea sp.]
MRVSAWLAIIALVVLGEVLHNETVAASAVAAVLAVLWLTSPHALRGTILAVAAVGRDRRLRIGKSR